MCESMINPVTYYCCQVKFTFRISWKLLWSIKRKKFWVINNRQDSWTAETAKWTGSVHLTSGVHEESLSQWFKTSMADATTCNQDNVFCYSTFKLLGTEKICHPLLACNVGNYIISSVMHAFWLALTYDLLEDRRI